MANNTKKSAIVLFLLIALASNAYSLADITFTGNANNFKTLAYDCTDNTCAAVKQFSGSFPNGQSTTNGKLTIRFPSTLASENGYALFFVSEGMVPLEFKSTIHTFGNDNIFTREFPITFNKVPVCRSFIQNFQILNTAQPNVPLIINVGAKLDAETYSAFKKINKVITHTPQELIQTYYSADTRVTLEIKKDSTIVNKQTKEFTAKDSTSLFADMLVNVDFSYTPQTSGEHIATITTEVIDDQCAKSEQVTTSKQFTVLQSAPTNECYTILNNLKVSNQNPQTNEDVTVTYQKTSNLAVGGVLTPVKTKVTQKVADASNTIVYEQTVNHGENANAANPSLQAFTFKAQKAGAHKISITGIAEDTRCAGKNTAETITNDLFVKNISTTQPTNPTSPTNSTTKPTVTFAVRDEQGNPIQNATVTVSSTSTQTSAAGQAAFQLDKGTYTFTVSASGFNTVTGQFTIQNDLGLTVTLTRTQRIISQSERTTIKLNSFKIISDSVDAGDQLTASFSAENEGTSTLRRVTASATIAELGIRSSVGPFDLKHGDREQRRIVIDIPDGTEPGTYLVRFTIGSGKHKRTVYREVEVNE